MTPSIVDTNAWHGKRVLVTGHTGFKGSWLSLWLNSLGADVAGLSNQVPPAPALFAQADLEQIVDHNIADVRDAEAVHAIVERVQPEVVFHLAAQPFVRRSFREPLETYETNVMGTANVLDGVRRVGGVKGVVVVTSDKCYANNEWPWGYRENDRIGGHDPYSASKAAVELLTTSYRSSFFSPAKIADHGVRLASARAGNVIGGGDWALDRIVPDIVRSLIAEKPISIRCPNAIRPWQHVLEPLSGYLKLASRLMTRDDPHDASAWNFGPTIEGNQTVLSLAKTFCKYWGSGSWDCDGSTNRLHETNVLRLSIEKALTQLDWKPTWNFETTIEKTAHWYRRHALGDSMMQAACRQDIEDFVAASAKVDHERASAESAISLKMAS